MQKKRQKSIHQYLKEWLDKGVSGHEVEAKKEADGTITFSISPVIEEPNLETLYFEPSLTPPNYLRQDRRKLKAEA